MVGTYSCAGDLAARITKSITIRGLGDGPLIDCSGSGSAFDIRSQQSSSTLNEVLIENFHIENANGGIAGFVAALLSALNWWAVGGVWVQNTLNFTILSSNFKNCNGTISGGIGFEGGAGAGRSCVLSF